MASELPLLKRRKSFTHILGNRRAILRVEQNQFEGNMLLACPQVIKSLELF
jgi:hypothetical protein